MKFLLIVLFFNGTEISHSVTQEFSSESDCGYAGLEISEWSSLGGQHLPANFKCIKLSR